ncbi:DUF1697 domain-containing protein [Tabrizicola sp.]|jgi:uncharacterized protein (DUF1697 family)|uniref:DUF1697 domain-containing protein n=1 Tax=Tabrizicola sp. TaxID=2005166 RepID=UPI001A3A6194|nr:DUF1697 domain-containing protein [Tabrizicola sp.]MBL9064489.1 DUF1697 domain-containing protein [Tabrizicola sp.]
MGVRIALLRGVNVGGAGKLPMAEFREMLAGLGLGAVRTYIQSGNAVFESDLEAPELERIIHDGVAARFGFSREIFVLTAADLAEALSDHPFAGADGGRVHVYFLRETPALEEAKLKALALPGDGWHVGPRRFTLHTPGGVGTSKLAEKLPHLLPAPMTARNLRTIAALHAMAG